MSDEVPRSVFVTGALGFIGRAVCERYRALGAQVRGVDLRAEPRLGVVRGDVARRGDWQGHADGCELLVHTAATVSLRLERPDEVWEANVLGTLHAIEAAERAGVRRLVHLSSVTVFGLDFPDGVDERHPVRPTGIPYADTKIASEQVALQAHAEQRAPVTIVRPGDVYGPGSRAWALVPTELIRARRFALPARGRGIFSPTYVDNLVDALVLAAATPEAAGQVITITDGIGVPTRAFFAPYAELVGRRLVTIPTAPACVTAWVIQQLARRSPGDNDVNPAAVAYMSRSGTYSIERARRLLGFEPAIGLEEGQRRTLAWLRDRIATGG